MYPRNEQEIADLLATGQITSQEAQMYRAQLSSPQQGLFGDVFSTPDRNTWLRSNEAVMGGRNNGQNYPNLFNTSILSKTDPSLNLNAQGIPTISNPSISTPSVDRGTTIFDAPYLMQDNTSEVNTPLAGQFPMTEAEYNAEQRNKKPFFPTPDGRDPNDMTGEWRGSYAENTQPKNNRFPFLYPGGSDISTEIYTLGRGLGLEKGTQGRGLMIAGSAGAALFDVGRNLTSGIGYSKANQAVDDWYRDQQYGAGSRRYGYTAAPQTRNTNNQGVMPFEDGGLFKFPDGGEMMSEEQMAQEGPMPAMNQAPQQDIMQQMVQGVAQALQQGQSPEQIVQALTQQGIPQEQAVQLVQQVIQMMQQQSPQEQAPQEEQPMMKNGGVFKYKVGDPIKFRSGGKWVSGKIKTVDLKTGKFTI